MFKEWDNWGEEATSGDDQETVTDNALNQITLSSIPPPSNKPVIVVESKKLQDGGDSPSLDGKVQLRPLPTQPLLPQVAAAKDVAAKEEPDFFADMTPDIPTQTSVLDKIEKAISNQKVGTWRIYYLYASGILTSILFLSDKELIIVDKMWPTTISSFLRNDFRM